MARAFSAIAVQCVLPPLFPTIPPLEGNSGSAAPRPNPALPQAILSAAARAARLALTSLTAALMASSASIEQCSLTGGSERWLAMSRLRMAVADVSLSSAIVRPLTHSVATLEAAMAERRGRWDS